MKLKKKAKKAVGEFGVHQTIQMLVWYEGNTSKHQILTDVLGSERLGDEETWYYRENLERLGKGITTFYGHLDKPCRNILIKKIVERYGDQV